MHMHISGTYGQGQCGDSVIQIHIFSLETSIIFIFQEDIWIVSGCQQI